jgi:hypothetical protein
MNLSLDNHTVYNLLRRSMQPESFIWRIGSGGLFS